MTSRMNYVSTFYIFYVIYIAKST